MECRIERNDMSDFLNNEGNEGNEGNVSNAGKEVNCNRCPIDQLESKERMLSLKQPAFNWK
jgi:hypothetical protein